MVIILLPAYNEEKSLPQLFEKFKKRLEEYGLEYSIVVCDDGSSDRTNALLHQYAEQMPIQILQHKINRGLGETVRDLFEHAIQISAPDDIIIRLDCDDTHEPRFIKSMIDRLGEGDCDVVIASRFQEGGGQQGVNAYRTFISRCASFYMKCMFNIKNVKDYSSGYRAFRASILKKAIDHFGNDFIQLKGVGFTCTVEKLIKLKLVGARFAEVPFMLRYDQKQSDSKMVSSITTLGYFLLGLLYHWPSRAWRVTHKKQRS